VGDVSYASRVAGIVLRALAAGKAVEIDGLGIFFPDQRHGFRFEPRPPQVFLAYVREDLDTVQRLYDALTQAGFSPWLDVRKLLPGQNWPRAIECAIEGSQFFVACFSEHSADKWGGFQAEIRYALDCARRMPLDEIFVIPVRLNNCRVPRSIVRELQYVDLFPDWECGLTRLLSVLRSRMPALADLTGAGSRLRQ
jgi:TIR domain